ncbi:Ubiquitin carboxyl-terminal hydrolase 31 [Gurleya vavrai]
MEKKQKILTAITLISFFSFIAIAFTISNKFKNAKNEIKQQQNQNSLEYKNLPNCGKISYVNSIIQALFTQKEFVNVISKTKNDHAILFELNNIFNFLNDTNNSAKSINTYKIVEILNQNQAVQFHKDKQVDAYLFLFCFLNFFELKLCKNNAKLFNTYNLIFNGKVQKINNIPEFYTKEIKFKNLEFKINKNVTDTILSFIVDTFILEGKPSKPILPIVKITEPPSCLIVPLLRVIDGKKDKTPILIQKTIFLPNYIIGNKAYIKKNINFKFDLNAIIVHYGDNLYTGNYIAYCKNNGKWTCFDGTKKKPVTFISEIDFDRLLKKLESNVYILFYQSKR